MLQRRGLIVTGGRAPAVPVRITDRDRWCVVAADSGVDVLEKIGVQPDAIVGDMDSISHTDKLEEFPKAHIERYPRDKDHTDTEIACLYLRRADIASITILGGGGGRLDHLLGIASLFDRTDHPARWLTHRDDVLSIDEEIVIECEPGEVISLLPVGSVPSRMSSDGLKWPLNGLVWKKGDIGISNEATGGTCRITMLEGRLILVRSLPKTIVLQ